MLLRAEGLCKAFDNVTVLQDISFKVAPGEVVSLVGKSGAGKTTVLRCITGLEKCDKGTIEINGKYICSMENGLIKRATKEQLFEVRKDLGMVFQNYHLFPHLTVAENVTLALTEVYKMPKQEALTKAKEILTQLDMGDKLEQKPFSLSGGQKQRVAIARSCVTNPKLLCFDEPTAALDSALVLDIIKIIRGLAKEGMGILIISHDEKFVRDVSDRVLFMVSGSITKELTAEEYEKYIRE